jgi:uncharacterized RDD family membrane protein YckC
LSSLPEVSGPAPEILDTVVAAETPEGILLELRPAGLPARFYAFALDWIIRLFIIYAAAMLASFTGGIGYAFWIILIFALEWFYPVVFELMPGGATPGKRVFGLRVVMDNGLPTTTAASVTRNLLRAAEFLPFCYGFAIVSMLVRRDCKRLGDIAAATLVVHQPRAVSRPPLDEFVPVAPVRPLAPRDRAAVIALAARASMLTTERLDELAALAAPVSGDTGRTGRAVTVRVLGVAQWLLGRRA